MPYPSGLSAEIGSSTRVSAILAGSDRRLLSLVYLLDGQFGKAQKELTQLSLELPNDAAIHNDLGVAHMVVARSDPPAWLKALGEFQAASALRPEFPEAQFNLVIVCRHLGLSKLRSSAAEKYQGIETDISWRRSIGLAERAGIDERLPVERLETAMPEEIADLVRHHPSDVRRMILDYSFRPALPVPPNYLRVADELSNQYGDQTAKAALAAFSGNKMQAVVNMRDLVRRGRALYERDHVEEARTLYAAARQISEKTASVFDHVWVEINMADAMQRKLEFSQAANLYRDAVNVSQHHGLKWLWARALSSAGANPVVTGGLRQGLETSTRAVELYREIGETMESSRPFYFLSAYYSSSGSYDESLKFAVECIHATDPGDHYRLGAVDSVIATVLNWTGHTDMAISFSEEALEHSFKLQSSEIIVRNRINLATSYLDENRIADALSQLEQAKRLLPGVPAGTRDMVQLMLGLRHAEAVLSSDLPAAESELRNNIAFIREHRVAAAMGDYSSRIVLADVLSRQDRNTEAEAEVLKAVDSVEAFQDELPNDESQTNFDHDRRQVYDSAIRFVYRQSGCKESWRLADRYKTKLFLNSMRDPAASGYRLQLRRLSLEEVRSRLPASLQIIDYFVLGDRLLVWVISRNDIQCREVSVDVGHLRDRVAAFVSQVTDQLPLDRSSEDLYDILVQPISHLLDSSHTIAIIPDGSLYRVPFSALRSRITGRYWIETMPIVESPSVTYLLSDDHNESVNGAHTAFGSRRYDALTETELKTVQNLDPAIRFEAGPQLDRPAFLKALRESSLFYYAGHSAFDMQNAMQSSILLDGDRSGPNAISALDIMQQPIRKNARIFLSSCETSVGSTTDGLAIGGLTSAFLLGGAGSVVGSLWPVESASTMELMSGAFDQLVRQRHSPAESLRSAQIAMIRNGATRHPYFWSGFVVTGNGSAIRP